MMPELWKSKDDMAVALLTVRDEEAAEVRRATDTGAFCRDVLWRECCYFASNARIKLEGGPAWGTMVDSMAGEGD